MPDPRFGDLMVPVIHRTEVDGIPTFWADVPRPFTAGLMFRVGLFDEPVRARGITHLVEHLALANQRGSEVEFNASVDTHITGFWAWGMPEKVGQVLSEVCRSIHNLPIERLELEAAVLSREAEMRNGTHFEGMLASYYGPMGPGAWGAPEFGLSWLDGTNLKQWASTHFTADNVALAIMGKPPATWGLDLPPGRSRRDVEYRRLRPAPQQPTLHDYGVGGVSWSALAKETRREPSPGVQIGHGIVVDRIEEKLRHELGHTYAVTPVAVRIDSEHLFLGHGFECAIEESRAAFVEHNGVIEEFIEHGPTKDELGRALNRMVNSLEDHPHDSAREWVVRDIRDFLAGWGPSLAMVDWAEEIAGATPKDVADRFAELYRQSFSVGRFEPGDNFQPMSDMRNVEDLPFEGVQFEAKPFARNQIPKMRVGNSGISVPSGGGWVNLAADRIALIQEIDGGLQVNAVEASFAIESSKYWNSRSFLNRTSLLLALVSIPVVSIALFLVGSGVAPMRTLVILIGALLVFGYNRLSTRDEREIRDPSLGLVDAFRQYLPEQLFLPEPRPSYRPPSTRSQETTPR